MALDKLQNFRTIIQRKGKLARAIRSNLGETADNAKRCTVSAIPITFISSKTVTETERYREWMAASGERGRFEVW